MLKEKDAAIRKAMLLLDAVVLTVGFIITFYLRRHFHAFYKLDIIASSRVVAEMATPFTDYLVALFFIIPVWCAMFHLNGMYMPFRTRTFLDVFRIIIKSVFFSILAFGTIVFLFKLEFISRVFFIMFLIISTAAILAEKTAILGTAHYLRRQGYNYRMLLIVGTGKRAEQFVNTVKRHSEWGFRIEGIIDYEKTNLGKEIDGVKVIGTLEDIALILHTKVIDEVIFIVPRAMLGAMQDSIYTCETEGVSATVAVDLFDTKIARSRQTELDGIPFITFETTSSREWQLLIKRMLDVALSAFSIIVLSPALITTAVLIKLTSRGPVFYLQKRVGLNGRRFALYKFRSMYKGSHEKLSELMERNEMKGPIFKMKKDPRITSLGKLLRKFSIDELPQLFNVFNGEMSLVGPRPALAKEVALYEPWQRRRLSMRPGITCIWQVSGRSKIGFDEWMKLDLDYIDNWSLWLDLRIIAKTFPTVLLGIGAY